MSDVTHLLAASAAGDHQAVEDLNEALTRLAAFDPEGAKLVRRCYFELLTFAEVAAELGISTATAYRRLKQAEVWLSRELSGESLRRELTGQATTSPEVLPASAPQTQTVEVGSDRWHQLNKRRGELILKKNRGGLTELERAEYEHLQQLCGEAIERAFPRPKLSPDQLALLEKALDSPPK